MTQPNHNLVAAGYDAVYAAMPDSPTLWRIWREHAAGADFPAEFSHISFVTLPQLRHMASELRVSPGDTLVDLGCGLAGPSLWVARETGAQLIGVDISSVAVAQATARAAALGMAERASFVVGTFAATTLPDSSANAIMSEDALQYAPDKRALFAEAVRILRPAGRIAFTAFEIEPSRASGLPVLGANPVPDYQPLMEEAGFAIDSYEEVPGWREALNAAYQASLDAKEELVAELGDAAFGALALEMTLTLQNQPYRRRVLAVATKQ
jgi:SAM-dependent methyltransferase